MTVANTHITVLLAEAVTHLIHNPDGVYVDGTFGRGGHSQAILDALSPAGRLIGVDRDLSAVAVGQSWTDPRFTMVHNTFSSIATIMAQLGVVAVDGILLDVGVSSPQLDDGARGFSFNKDAPLDMRMDTSGGVTAADVVNTASEAALAQIIREYGEEPQAARIAAAIVAARSVAPILSTGQLAAIVDSTIRFKKHGFHSATLTFQAIRIHVNQELHELDAALAQAQECLTEGGRLAVISFHSLEDRRVKQAFRPAPVSTALRYMPRSEAVHPWKEVARIKPSDTQCKTNPRARSAVLRVAVRQGGLGTNSSSSSNNISRQKNKGGAR
jgi:16S rRNA (cytosine1402-N4)-methyltransferase